MKTYKAKSGFSGIALGKFVSFSKENGKVHAEKMASAFEQELSNLNASIEKARESLSETIEKVKCTAGLENAALFEVQKMLLDDPEYMGNIKEMIVSDGLTSYKAILKAKERAVEKIKATNDSFVQERIDDIEDVSKLLLDMLGESREILSLTEDSIVYVSEITPSEFVRLCNNHLKGVVFENKSQTSHVGILAKASGVPVLFGTDKIEEIKGEAIIDGGASLLIMEPDTDTLLKYKAMADIKETKTVCKENSKLPIRVCANIEGLMEGADLKDADGVGLFRTEYLFMDREVSPTEEEQFKEYKRVVESMNGRPVTIRFCDLGADKKVSYIDFGDEKNPALGFRGIRVLLAKKELFITQICAALRAAYFGPVKVMFPMINSVTEVKEGKALIDKAREVLRSRGEAFGSIDTGVMIETPAAALLSDEISKEVDFMSIGTNDLSQFTLAIDRENTKCEGHTDSENKAVMRLIKMVVDAGKKNNCKTTICGELAADVSISGELLKYGVDELSVSPLFIPKVKEKIRNLG